LIKTLNSSLILVFLIWSFLVGKTAFFSATAFLRRFWQICFELDHQVFTSLDLATIFLIQSKVVILAYNP
jgi:hypothetical protein